MANLNPRPDPGARSRRTDPGARTRTKDPGMSGRTTDPGAPVRTTDQLRDDIDHGQGGDKKGFPDPAAAPLGTDAEAAGAPPTPRERDMAYRAEIANRPDGPSASDAQRPIAASHANGQKGPERVDNDALADEPAGPSVLIFIGIIAAVVAVILAAWLL